VADQPASPPSPWQATLGAAGTVLDSAHYPTARHPARAGEVWALTVGDLVLGGEEPYVRVVGKGSVTRDCPLSTEVV